jgi:heme-degrading monooxygenase HmoA
MYIVHNRINVPADQAEQFEQHFSASMASNLEGVAGLVRTTLLKPTKEDQPWVSTMEFATKEDFMGWLGSDSFKAAHAGVAEAGRQMPAGIEAFDVVAEERPGA